MTLLVRDEEDVVDATVRFHLDRGVDLVLVTDNLSLDRTRDLLAPYERAGVVQVWTETNDEYRQWEWVSRMAQLAASRHAADWVLHCDADEFWWTDRPLPEVLAAVPPEYDVVRAARHDFLPLEADSGRPFLERMTVRDTAPRNILGRPLLAKCAHRGRDDVIVAQGNHFVVNEGMTEMPGDLDAVILHFPVRSHAQLERKVVLGGRAYARNAEMPVTVGNTWRILHEAYLAGELGAYLDGLVPDEPTLVAGLASGRYVVDTRLRDALEGRLQTPPEPVRLAWPEEARSPDVRRALDLVGEAVATVPAGAAPGAPHHHAEQQLMAFVDDARTSLTVVADTVASCGVLAALAGARQRGVRVRVMTADPTPTADWRLDGVTRRVPAGSATGLVLRDESAMWTGPAALDWCSWRTCPSTSVRLHAGHAVLAAADRLWALAATVTRLPGHALAGAER